MGPGAGDQIFSLSVNIFAAGCWSPDHEPAVEQQSGEEQRHEAQQSGDNNGQGRDSITQGRVHTQYSAYNTLGGSKNMNKNRID